MIDALIDDLQSGHCAQPFNLLGCHDLSDGSGKIIRVWRPDASSISVVSYASGDNLGSMIQSKNGLFELELPNARNAFIYQLVITNKDHQSFTIIDPYQFHAYSLGHVSFDRYRQYRYLGAHPVTLHPEPKITIDGVIFRVYAPSARSVSITSSFNGWDSRAHPMSSSDSGVWCLFIPHVCPGDLYKYEIRNQQGELLPHKSDPYGFYAEQPPGNASIIFDHGQYEWQDSHWKHHCGLHQAVSIYELHMGSWKKMGDRPLTYHELAEQLIPYVVDMGFTHIELMPPMEHPFYWFMGLPTRWTLCSNQPIWLT